MITLEKTSSTFAVVNVTRRSFLQGALSASAFVLCVAKTPLFAKAAGNVASGSVAPSIDATAFHPSVFLGIQPDGTVRSSLIGRKWATESAPACHALLQTNLTPTGLE